MLLVGLKHRSMSTMKLVFIDDSGQQNPPRADLGRLVALGAVIVPEDEVTGWASDLLAMKV
jgi:hypothetical protein